MLLKVSCASECVCVCGCLLCAGLQMSTEANS